MSVQLYEGEISHANGLGQKGGYTVATTSPEFAQAFGKTVSGNTGTIKNGKMSMYRIAGTSFSSGETQGVVAVDPREVNRIDPLNYAEQHHGEIYDWYALAQALGEQYSTEFDIESSAVRNGLRFNNLNNNMQTVILKLHFGEISLEEAQAEFVDNSKKSNFDQDFSDLLRRRLKTIQNKKNGQRLAGVEYNIFGKTGGGIKVQPNSVKIKFDLTCNVIGSKSRGHKQEKERFANVKRFIQSTVQENSADHEFTIESKDVSVKDAVDNVYTDVYTELRQTVNKTNEIIQNTSEFADYPDFNRASALSKLWNDLGLGSDVGVANLDDEQIKRYWDKEITCFEFAHDSQNMMAQRVAKAVIKKRLSENKIDYESIGERLADELEQDYTLDNDPVANRREITQKVIGYAQERVESIRSSVENAQSFTFAYRKYTQTIKEYEQDIIEYATKKLRQLEGDSRNEDVKFFEACASHETDITLHNKLDEAYERFATNAHLRNVDGAMQNDVPRIALINNIELVVNEIKQGQRNLPNDEYEIKDIVNDYLNSKQDSYYDGLVQNVYDFEQGMEAARNQIYENAKASPKYKFVTGKYIRQSARQITSLPQLCLLADLDEIDTFMDRYASDWENNLDEEAVKAQEHAERVQELKKDTELKADFESLLKEQFEAKFEEFVADNDIGANNIYVPATISVTAYEQADKNEMYQATIDTLVSNDPNADDYSGALESAVKQINLVDGLSFDETYKTLVAQSGKPEEARDALITLATIIPPYRNQEKDYWQKQFDLGISDPNKFLKLLKFANAGDIASAVEYLGTDVQKEAEAEPAERSFTVYKNSLVPAKDMLEEQLQTFRLKPSSILYNGEEVSHTFDRLQDEITSEIKPSWDKLQNKEAHTDDGVLLVSGSFVQENPILLNKEKIAVDGLIKNHLLPYAEAVAKDFLANRIADINKGDRGSKSEDYLTIIDTAIKTCGTHAYFNYVDNDDAEGFLNEYYPDWRRDKSLNGTGIPQEIYPEWSNFLQRLNYETTDHAWTALTSAYSDIQYIVSQKIVNSAYYTKVTDEYKDACRRHAIDLVDKASSIEDKQNALSDVKEITRDGTVIAVLNDGFTVDKLERNVVGELRSEALEGLENALENDKYLDTMDDWAVWTKLKNKLAKSTSLEYVNQWNTGDISAFIEAHRDELPLDNKQEMLDRQSALQVVDRVLNNLRDDFRNRIFAELAYRGYDPEFVTIPEDKLDAMIEQMRNNFHKFISTLYDQGKPVSDEIITDSLEEAKEDAEYAKIIGQFVDTHMVEDVKTKVQEIASQLMAKTKPYNAKPAEFWKQTFTLAKIDGNFAMATNTEDTDYMAGYAPDWNADDNELDDPQEESKFRELYARRVMSCARNAFPKEKTILIAQTPSGTLGGLASDYAEVTVDDMYEDYKDYKASAKNKDANIIHNFLRRKSLRDNIEAGLRNMVDEDDIRSEVADKLRKAYGNAISDSDFAQIMNQHYDLTYLISALNDVTVRNEILEAQGIQANYDMDEMMSLNEVFDLVNSVVEDLMPDFATGKPFEEYLMDKKLNNDGTYGRKSDAVQAGNEKIAEIENKMCDLVRKSIYNDKKYVSLFTPSGHDSLVHYIKVLFEYKSKEFSQWVFAKLIMNYQGRLDSMYQTAVADFLKPYLKGLKGSENFNYNFIDSRIKGVTNLGEESLVSCASTGQGIDVWISEHIGSIEDLQAEPSAEKTAEANENAEKGEVGKIVETVLAKRFNEAYENLHNTVEFAGFDYYPNAVKSDIKAHVDQLIQEHKNFVMSDIKDESVALTDQSEVEKYVVEDEMYTNDEITSIIAKSVDFSKYAEFVEDITDKLLETYDEADYNTVFGKLEKLGTEDLVSFYADYPNVDGFVSRFQIFE